MNLDISHVCNANRIPFYSQIEKLNPYNAVTWAGILGNRESSSFERVLAETIEESSGYQLTRRSIALRDICCHLEKASWYLSMFENLLSQFKDQVLYTEFSYLSFCLHDCIENWSGVRLMPRLICLGGVNRDLKLGNKTYIAGVCRSVLEELSELQNFLLLDPFLRSRLADIDEELRRSDFNFSYLLEQRSMKEEVKPTKVFSFHKEVLDKIEARPVANMDKEEIRAEDFFVKSFVELVSCLENILLLLEQLPEGDHRVFIDHLHIPGGQFFHQKVSAPSGWLFAYYCSGKIRFSSFSSRLLAQLNSQKQKQLHQETALLMGLDLVQGVNCDTTL